MIVCKKVVSNTLPMYIHSLNAVIGSHFDPSEHFGKLDAILVFSIQFLQQIIVKNIHQVLGAGIRTHNISILSLLPLPIEQGSRMANLILYLHGILKQFRTVVLSK